MPPAKRPVKKKKKKSSNGCLIITTLLLILVAISLAATFYLLFLRPGPMAPPPTRPEAAPTRGAPGKPAIKTNKAAAVTATRSASAGGVVEGSRSRPETGAAPSTTPGQRPGPRLAIIIDDIGNTRTIAEELIALDLPLAFSIFPHSPHANHLATLAKARGHELLIHLPMEANDPKWTPMPGTLLLSMSRDQLIATINHDLDSPYRPVGINNHMGSRFSEDPEAMGLFLNAIKGRGLFFIDSLTSVKSVGHALARDLGVKTAKRDVFLDNEQDQTMILAQIGKVIALARKRGRAIAIGHPHPATLEALRVALPRLSHEVTVVPVQELVE